MTVKKLLFISPGNNLVFLGPAVRSVQQEQQVTLQADNILTYQVSDHAIGLDEVERRAAAADIVLFDIRAFPDLVQTLRRVREAHPEKTLIPLMGGSMDVLTLCRMGPFSFDRFASASSTRQVNYRRIQQITSLIERLGGMLPFGALKHARIWIRVVRYWTAGGAENITNMIRLIVREYCGGRGPAPAPPRELPQHFLCDPEGKRIYRSLKAWSADFPYANGIPVIAVLHYSGLHREASLAGVQALARCFEGRAQVLPIATNGVTSLEPLRTYLCTRRAPRIDALISLLWFRLDGGPLGGATEETIKLLGKLDVPYCVPVTLYGREVAVWREHQEGVSPVEAFATVVLPELDGALLPVPVLGVVRHEEDGFQTTSALAIQDRVAAFAERVLGWAHLRHIPRKDKRIALVLYDYPPGAAHAGNASYLDTAQSLRAILRHLAACGYDTGSNKDADPLNELLAAGIHNENSTVQWHGLRLSFDSYREAWHKLPEVCRSRVSEVFGPPPGQILVDTEGFRIPGKWYGNVLVVFQPARMPGVADSRTVHNTALPPHHQYLAVYEYLKRSVNAVVHVGTHGTAEFMPGKQVGLSSQCFPDLLRGNLPQVYIYTIANPSEGSIARRRLQSCLITHHLPDFIPAGLYGAYQELLDLIERSRDPGIGEERRQELCETVLKRAADLDMSGKGIDEIADELHELKHATIPKGLHVFGVPKDGASLVSYLTQLLSRPLAGVCLADLCPKNHEVFETLRQWAQVFVTTGALPTEVARQLSFDQLHHITEALTTIARDFLADRELASLVQALDGRYVEPGLLGDSLRSPQVYPAGRNGCSFDPTRIPFPDAVARGELLARQLLEHYRQQYGTFPRTVGLVLWGFETARSGGETIGMFLYLVGARLKENAGWLPAFEVVPLEELGRPRIDTYLMICGFFRDMFPTLVRDLDKLLEHIAQRDEPAELNPLRAFQGQYARIFGPKQEEYGTAIPDHVDESRWSDSAEIGLLYHHALGYAYTAERCGIQAHEELGELFARTEVVSQVIDGQEYKIGDLDHYYEFLGGACRAIENLRGAKPQCLVGDTARRTPRVAAAGEEVRRWATTRILNPTWIEGMLDHDIHGAKKIEERVTNLLGLAATVGVPSSLFDRVCERFLQDEELFQRLRDNNPHATLSLTRRMAEAAERQLWQASTEQLAVLRQRYAQLDAELE